MAHLYHTVDTYAQKILKDIEAIYRGGKVVYERHGAYILLVGADSDDVSESEVRAMVDEITEVFTDYGFDLGNDYWFDFYGGDISVSWYPARY